MTQGIERTFEGLENKSNGYDPPTVLVNDPIMPTRRKKKRLILITSLAILVTVALAAGLGKGLQKDTRYASSLL